ncbi:hypothetical protein DH2020_041824 [Rehmannia glutinosa]|uniref:Wings apart-like protein C-terminal domain-containing protein n=1 Tax=Rehmannia glutinosa TaxID=99300 RepID=A0ABR0UP25_REHGL
MIVRTYGRRSRALTRNYSDVVSESPSQECPQDVYDFTTSSQDSARCHWSDPYSFTPSQEATQLTILPPRKGGECGDYDGDLWKRKKVKVIDVDSEHYGSSSSQESKDYGVVEISDGDFHKSKNVKKISSDPYEFYSSQELEEFAILPQRLGRKSTTFNFSENGDFRKPEMRNVDTGSYGLNSSQELDDLGLSQSRECEGRDCWEFDGVSRNSKKKDNRVLQKKKSKNKMKTKDFGLGDLVLTTTLMETQEFGEMMEHVDEVNFALDGLKKGQQVRIQRASLLSLLSICGTAQQRRLLRIHGMEKTILDAVMELCSDDFPSNLAAAALVYLLTSDGQDDHLLNSRNCICFLIKLLNPLTPSATKEKAPTIGSKLLGMCKIAGLLQDSAKGTDSSSSAIMLKVQEILVSCKEMKPRDDIDNRMEERELNPKWISLLTMEKACLSTISIEGADLKMLMSRNSFTVEWLEKSPTFTLDLKDNSGLEGLLLLLKCLKIMENATFLSKDNQCYLLQMKGKYDGQRAPRSFTKLILSVIKILSGVSLLRSSLSNSGDEKMGDTSIGSSQKMGDSSIGSSHSGWCCNMELTASQRSLSMSQCNQSLISGQPGFIKPSLEFTQVSADPLLLKTRVESSTSVSCSGSSGNSNSIIHISSNDSESEVDFGKKQLICANTGVEDSQDPFAFDEDDLEPSKWDLLSGRVASCSSPGDEEKSNLLADCLLTAVKVLMNLANDNPEGCQQIATCGGLEILSSLIAGHFPSFSSLPHFVDVRECSLSSKSCPRIDQHSKTHLTDQELDFLVAILGLLVNLVEKDGRNRSRLAAASVSLSIVDGLNSGDQRDVVFLLCSIFLANHGAGEAAGEGKCLSLEDEDSMLQGEKEAEKMIVEAYAALLLAFLSTESKSIRNAIADFLPNRNLAILVPVLERFVEFHLTLNMISPETHRAVLEVIESCRIP